MTEVNTINDLEALKSQINAVRSKLKQGQKSGWRTSKIEKANEEIAKTNDQIYAASLPQEINVSAEMGNLLLSLFNDYLEERKKIETRYNPLKHSLMKVFNVWRLVVTPSPITLGLLAKTLFEENSSHNIYDKDLQELARKVDKNMHDTLGSYQLAKKPDGNYVLRRGSWFAYTVSQTIIAGPGSTVVNSCYTGVKNVGVHRDLLSAEMQTFIDKKLNSPEKSPQVGHWVDHEPSIRIW